MAETPTRDDVLTERPDLETMIDGNNANLSIDSYITKALEHVQRNLREQKGIKWAMVYDSDEEEYFTDTDGAANNKDSIEHMIILMTIALVFKDYSISATDSNFWDLYLAYRQDYDAAINQAKLDIDWNESGAITEDEEVQTTQTYLRN